MKSIKELRELPFTVSSERLFFCNIRDIGKRVSSGMIDLDVYLPSKKMNLQRDFVWNLMQKRELVLSVFTGRKIPHISVMDDIPTSGDALDDVQLVIDGKQRLSTLRDYYEDKFSVELEGKDYLYSELPDDYQLAFGKHPILCQLVYSKDMEPFSDEDKITWFNLINFSGTPQDKEHMERLLK
jgi:hypothetical protein